MPGVQCCLNFVDGTSLGLGFSCQMELLLKVNCGISLLFIFLDMSQREQNLFPAHLGLFLLECSFALVMWYFKTNIIKIRKVKLSLVGLSTPALTLPWMLSLIKGVTSLERMHLAGLPLPPISPWAESLETPCIDQSTWLDPRPPSLSEKLWNESDSLRYLVEVPDRSLGRCQQAPGELATCGHNGKIFPFHSKTGVLSSFTQTCKPCS